MERGRDEESDAISDRADPSVLARWLIAHSSGVADCSSNGSGGTKRQLENIRSCNINDPKGFSGKTSRKEARDEERASGKQIIATV